MLQLLAEGCRIGMEEIREPFYDGRKLLSEYVKRECRFGTVIRKYVKTTAAVASAVAELLPWLTGQHVAG